MGRKLKVYLDTSVISHLWHDDAPEKMAATRRLWKRFEAGEFGVCLSEATLEELRRCPEPLRAALYDYMGRINYAVLPLGRPAEALALKIVAEGILARKSFFDCLHIAAATVHACDCLASWDLKHMVRKKTMEGVGRLAAQEGYGAVDIVTPLTLLEREAVRHEC